MPITIAPIQLTHIIISIPLFILGFYVIWHSKEFGKTMADAYDKKFQTFMDGIFLEGSRERAKWGFYRILVTFFGVMIVIGGWIIAVGTVYIGNTAQYYQYSQHSN